MTAQRRQQSISELRKQLPTLLDEVASSGEALVVTKRGRPLVRIVPLARDGEQDEALPLRGIPLELAPDFDRTSEESSESSER
jgi:prevent-host-death family protein